MTKTAWWVERSLMTAAIDFKVKPVVLWDHRGNIASGFFEAKTHE
jgi:hypothetical protein